MAIAGGSKWRRTVPLCLAVLGLVGAAPRARPQSPAGQSPATTRAAVDDLRASQSAGNLSPALAAAAEAGWTAYQRGDTKAARAALEAPARDPGAPAWVHYVLGWADFAEQDFAAAQGEWDAVRRAAPTFEPVYLNLADSYLRRQQRDQALNVLQQAEARWPKDADVLNALGTVLVGAGHLDEAIATFTRAIATDASDANAHFNLARSSEIRYVQALGGHQAADSDRTRAVQEYRRVVALGGAEVGEARMELRRLEPLDARQLTLPAPVAIATYSDRQFGGKPIGLAWSPDGRTLAIRAVDAFGRSTFSDVTTLVSLPAGTIERSRTVPAWVNQYWKWKSAAHAPWRPDEELSVQNGRAQQRASSPFSGAMAAGAVYRFHGQVVQRPLPFSAPGQEYGWSPCAMGALVYVDRRGVVVIMDDQGHQAEVKGTPGALLPAWSPDGRQIAWLTYHGTYQLFVMDVPSR